MKKGAVLAFLLLFMHVGLLYAEEKSIYKKVTSTSELVKGSQYIIVRENDTQAYAMGKIGVSKTGAGAKVAVTLQGDMIINPSTDAVVYTLGVSGDFWTLKCSSGYLSAKDAETNMEYKNSKDEREIILKSYNDTRNKLKRRKKENEKLHDLKYGRF